MSEYEATRTLVKSPPELWAVCSDAESLARHLEPFGEIRITRLEPETAVAWEGARTCGTVRIEPSGWGTRVTLTASELPVAIPEPARIEFGPVSGAVVAGGAAARGGLLGRLAARMRRAQVASEPAGAEPAAVDELRGYEAALDAALDSLGQAHHRPFSRS
jgi:hypothetical protein